jgi:hypothetical protein
LSPDNEFVIVVIRYRLAVHGSAKEDLESISRTDFRDFNHDASDPRSQRVIALYDELGIPSYR